MIDLADIPIRTFTQSKTIRLISTAYIDEPALSPLVDDSDNLAFLEEFEGLTSTRQAAGIPLPSGLFAEELLTQRHGYGWSYVNAAFCYTRSTGNRFNGPDRGAWYATWGQDAIKTAHAEVIWHLTRELEATGVFENITSYRELWTAFTTDMHDLTQIADEVIYSPDPLVGYPAGQNLAANLRSNGANGILYRSVRHNSGMCLVAFRPNIVQNIRQGSEWNFIWEGNPNPTISKTA